MSRGSPPEPSITLSRLGLLTGYQVAGGAQLQLYEHAGSIEKASQQTSWCWKPSSLRPIPTASPTSDAMRSSSRGESCPARYGAFAAGGPANVDPDRLHGNGEGPGGTDLASVDLEYVAVAYLMDQDQFPSVH